MTAKNGSRLTVHMVDNGNDQWCLTMITFTVGSDYGSQSTMVTPKTFTSKTVWPYNVKADIFKKSKIYLSNLATQGGFHQNM